MLGSGGVLNVLCEGYHLSPEFRDVYASHYAESISFIDAIVNDEISDSSHEFYVSSLAINELFYAMKDELRSIILFNKGMPISRWRDARANPEIPEKCFRAVYNKTFQSFDTLFEEGRIHYITEGSAESDPEVLVDLRTAPFPYQRCKDAGCDASYNGHHQPCGLFCDKG